MVVKQFQIILIQRYHICFVVKIKSIGIYENHIKVKTYDLLHVHYEPTWKKRLGWHYHTDLEYKALIHGLSQSDIENHEGSREASMNKNGYTKDDFLNEYDWEHTSLTPYETCVGLEFDYKNNHYRISREVGDANKFYLIKVTFLDKENEINSPNYEYQILGIYDDIQSLLQTKKIDDKKLENVLFCELTEITDQD